MRSEGTDHNKGAPQISLPREQVQRARAAVAGREEAVRKEAGLKAGVDSGREKWGSGRKEVGNVHILRAA